MLYPQLLTYETDGLLAALLRPLAEQKQWMLREPRRLDACLRLLGRGHPTVLVIRAGSDLLEAMTLLERMAWLGLPGQTVVVADVHNPELFGLAWHLGASYVLMPPQPRYRLPEIVTSLMETAIQRRQSRRNCPRRLWRMKSNIRWCKTASTSSMMPTCAIRSGRSWVACVGPEARYSLSVNSGRATEWPRFMSNR
jgi:hypothetical protein